MKRQWIRGGLALCAGLLMSALVPAQIKVGQSSGFTGPAAAAVKEMTGGAKLYFEAVNGRGGVNGQTIELVSIDASSTPSPPPRTRRS